MRRTGALWVMVFFAASGISLSAQAIGQRSIKGGRILGRVLYAKGERSLPDAAMLTLSSSTGYRETVPLHPSGRFEFGDLRPGYYTLILECPGRKTTSKTIELAAGHDTGLDAFTTIQVGESMPGVLPPAGQEEQSADFLKLPPKVRKEISKGNAAAREGDSAKAVQHYRKAVKMEPDLFSVYNNMAVEYLNLGKLEEAADALKESIRVAPEHAATYKNLGVVQLDLDRPSEALESLKRSLELEAEHPETRMYYGEALHQLNRPAEALAIFSDLLQEGHDSADLRLDLGNACLKLNQLEQARQHYRSYLKMQPEGEKVDAVRDLLTRLDAALAKKR